LANYTVGTGGDFADLETIATDPTANTAGNTWTLLEDLTPVANVAAIDTGVIVITNGFQVDTSQIASGVCVTGGTWEKAIIKRYNNTAATLISTANIDNCTVYAPLQDAACVGCTGDANSIVGLLGTVSGIAGSNNVFTVNISGAEAAYKIKNNAYYVDGINDSISFPELEMTELNMSVKMINTGTFAFVYDNRDSVGGTSFVLANNLGNWQYSNCTLEVDGVPVVSEVTPVNFSEVGQVRIASSSGTIPISRLMRKGTDPEFYANGCLRNIAISNSGGVISRYVCDGDWSTTVLTDHEGTNDGTIDGATPVLTTSYTPLIDGSLLLPNGSYAGAVNPYGVDIARRPMYWRMQGRRGRR